MHPEMFMVPQNAQRDRESEQSADYILGADVVAANGFVKDKYKKSGATKAQQEENMLHSEVVSGYAADIAKAEGLDPEFMALVGVCHDCGKLGANHPGNVNTFGHHHTGADDTEEYLVKERGKNDMLGAQVSNTIRAHSHIPFIVEWHQRQGLIKNGALTPDQSKEMERADIDRMVSELSPTDRAKLDQQLERVLPKPKTNEELALRDADMLAMIDVTAGLRKLVNIRQNPKGPFYAKDGGSLGKAIASAMQSAREAHDILHFKYSKKVGEELFIVLKKFLNDFAHSNASTLEAFNAFCDEWASQQERAKEKIAA